MRKIERTSDFRRDYRRAQAGLPPGVLDNLLQEILSSLAFDQPLAKKFRDHPLTGDWKHHRECHVRPNLLLIYRKEPGKLHLVLLGSHSEVFR